MTPDLVLVTWHDAHGSLTEYYANKMHAPAVMHTVGWLMEANDKGVSICGERSPDGQEFDYRGHTFIPIAMVLSVTKLTTTSRVVTRKKKR
jgi:hypothetical protein